jgi:hypothetical protein
MVREKRDEVEVGDEKNVRRYRCNVHIGTKANGVATEEAHYGLLTEGETSKDARERALATARKLWPGRAITIPGTLVRVHEAAPWSDESREQRRKEIRVGAKVASTRKRALAKRRGSNNER